MTADEITFETAKGSWGTMDMYYIPLGLKGFIYAKKSNEWKTVLVNARNITWIDLDE